MADYYKILGIEKNASEDEVKKAYRRLAHHYHPDKKGGDADKFKRINEAYQVLSSKEKRAQYDRFGRVFDGATGSPHGGGFGGGQGFPFGFSAGGGPASGWDFTVDPSQMGDLGSMSDIFDSFFEGLGVKRKRRTYRRGADLEMTQEITLEEAFRGVTKSIKFKTLVACRTCGGVGHFPAEGFTMCAVCSGRGEIRESRNTFFGSFEQVKTCSRCAGTGQIPNKNCSTCTGAGRIKDERAVEITIAPGVEDGQIIKVPKAGEVGERGADAGDLYVRVAVKPHHTFSREGERLTVKREAPLLTLLLERKIEVPTIAGGKLNVEIPSNFKLGDKLVVQGEGMPRFGRFGRGDLLVDVDVKLPKKLSERAKKLFEELRRELE